MIGLNVLFWIFVVLFGIIGLMRGWAKEILVSFSVVLGLFVISVIERYGGFLTTLLNAPGSGLFWMRFIILSALVFFGYQGPNIPRLAQTNGETLKALAFCLCPSGDYLAGFHQ